MNQLGFKVAIDLLAEVSDVDVHHVAGRLIGLIIYVIPNLAAADDFPFAMRQVFQQHIPVH